MSADGVGNAKALIRMGTPIVTFSSGGSAKINGDGKDLAKSSYHTRLHRLLILCESNIRYNKTGLYIYLTFQAICLTYPTYDIFYLNNRKSFIIIAFTFGIVAIILSLFKLLALKKWTRMRDAALAALDGEALDQYTPVKRNAAQRLITHIANRYNQKQRRILAILQLSVFFIPVIWLFIWTKGYGVILSFPLGILGIIFFSVIWPSKSTYKKRNDAVADNDEIT